MPSCVTPACPNHDELPPVVKTKEVLSSAEDNAIDSFVRHTPYKVVAPEIVIVSVSEYMAEVAVLDVLQPRKSCPAQDHDNEEIDGIRHRPAFDS